MSKSVYGVWNPKTVTLTTALVQWLADCQIYELQPIPQRSMVLPRRVVLDQVHVHDDPLRRREHRGHEAAAAPEHDLEKHGERVSKTLFDAI